MNTRPGWNEVANLLLQRILTSSTSGSHIFKTVSQEIRPSDGRSCHIAADGRRPCEGAGRLSLIGALEVTRKAGGTHGTMRP